MTKYQTKDSQKLLSTNRYPLLYLFIEKSLYGILNLLTAVWGEPQFHFGTINILRKLLHVIYESSLRTREQFFLFYVNAESDEALTVEIIQDGS